MDFSLISWSDASWFIGMTFIALFLGITPLRYPFQWLEVYYHELSHGLAALISRGWIVRIQLNWNGSGLCTTRGGSRFLILIAGYTGAALWGGYLYLAGWHITTTGLANLLFIELGLITFTTVFYVRDITTLLIMAISATVYTLPILFPQTTPFLGIYLQFTGIYVLLNAIRAPLHLIDGQHVGDGAALADSFLGLLPEAVWIAFWFLFALATLSACALWTIPGLSEALNLQLWWQPFELILEELK